MTRRDHVEQPETLEAAVCRLRQENLELRLAEARKEKWNERQLHAATQGRLEARRGGERGHHLRRGEPLSESWERMFEDAGIDLDALDESMKTGYDEEMERMRVEREQKEIDS